MAWWEELTERGGEGMVVKPLHFIARGHARARAARGEVPRPRVSADHLRSGVHAAREPRAAARARPARRSARSALREFALGVEALERFVASEPLRRVHECVFGVLALESEPVDPRL